MIKGYKTVLFGALVAIGPALVTYLGGVNWQSLGISPEVSAIIGVVIIGLRAITSTPIGSK